MACHHTMNQVSFFNKFLKYLDMISASVFPPSYLYLEARFLSFADDMMFFLKYYDADEKMTFFCGHIMINYKSMIRNYLPQILQKARLPPGTELKFYEVFCSQ